MSPPSLKRNWAKGQRLEFLQSHLVPYQSALRQSRARGAEYADTVVNKYFESFHWRLPIDEDPPTTSPVNPDSAPMQEDLTEEEQREKGEVISKMRKSIRSWLDYRVKKVDNSLVCRDDVSNDPYAVLLSKLTGQDQKPPKLLAGWQHWSKKNFEQHKEAFQEQFDASGKPGKERASARQEFIRGLFGGLPIEEQEMHNQAAVDEQAAAQKDFKERLAAPPSQDPRDRQMAIDRLGGFLGPILEGISVRLGMHVSVLVGGPEPRKNGQLNVISMHHGVNRAPVPKNWGMADKAKYKAVTQSFIEFLETCYTKEEQDARALHPDDPDCFADNEVPSMEDPTINAASGVISSSHEDEDRSSKTSGRKRKGRKPRNSKRRRVEDDLSTDASAEPFSDNPSSFDEEDADTIIIGTKKVHKLPFQVVPRKTPAQLQGRRTRPQPQRIQATTATNTTDVSMDAVSETPEVTMGTPEHVMPVVALPVDGSAAATMGAVSEVVASNSVGSEGNSCTVAASPNTVGIPGAVIQGPLDDSAWPTWFKNGFKPLQEAELGEKWGGLLMKYTNLEARVNFVSPKGIAHAFSSDKRPSEVEWWIARAHKVQPTIKSLPKFEIGFWAWWKNLQPKWREVGDVEGMLTSTHRVHDGNWMELEKPGQNGFLTVVSLLCWWGLALRDQRDVGDAQWQAAVDDVDWVLAQMLRAN